MDNLANYSDENRRKVLISLEILINAFELKDPKDNVVLKIVQNKFTKEHMEYEEALWILALLGRKDSLFGVLNEKLMKLLRESEPHMTDWQKKNDELREFYYQFNITEEDLKGYFLLEVKDLATLAKLKKIKSTLKIKNEEDKDAQDKPFDWKPDDKNHRGQLILKEKPSLKFHSGNFGGVDILISNLDHDVTTEDLRRAIFNHSQGEKNANQINIADWKYQLMKRRVAFAQHFRIDRFPPNKHRLVYIGN